MTDPAHTIVAALVIRRALLLLVEAQDPDDAEPRWMLPGGRVEPGEQSLEALRRELAEETGLRLTGRPKVAFAVEVDVRTDRDTGVYRAITYRCRATGTLAPSDPDGLVRAARWFELSDALARLEALGWYACEPLRRYLAAEAEPAAAYRYRVRGAHPRLIVDGLEVAPGAVTGRPIGPGRRG